MKKHIILSLFALVLTVGSYAQTTASSAQLVVVKADGKTWITDNNSISLLDSLGASRGITYLNPHWIDNISTMKGSEAVDKYGAAAKNGASIYEMSPGTFMKLKEETRKKFN